MEKEELVGKVFDRPDGGALIVEAHLGDGVLQVRGTAGDNAGMTWTITYDDLLCTWNGVGLE